MKKTITISLIMMMGILAVGYFAYRYLNLSAITIIPVKTIKLELSGNVSGLSGSGLVLGVNGASVPVKVNGHFDTLVSVQVRPPYVLTVKSQPSNPIQSCKITKDNGTNTSSMANIAVMCSPWTKEIGGVNDRTHGSAVAIDGEGNVYIAGYTEGGAEGLPPDQLFISKYTRSGEKLYTKKLKGSVGVGTGEGGAEVEYGISVATDQKNNVFVVGAIQGEFDGTRNIGSGDYILIKFNSNGKKLFSKRVGSEGVETSVGEIATDGNGNLFIASSTAPPGDVAEYITKFDEDGQEIYRKKVGGDETHIYSLTVDFHGNVILVGEKLLAGHDSKQEEWTQFLEKFDGNGDLLFAKYLDTGVEGCTQYESVAADFQGNIIAGGSTCENPNSSASPPGTVLLITKFNSDGEKLYSKENYLHVGFAKKISVTTDSQGNAFIAGYWDVKEVDSVEDSNILDLDGDGVVGNENLILAKYDVKGDMVYEVDRQEAALATSVAADKNGDVVITGDTSSGLDGNSLIGRSDAFLIKYDAKGNLR